MFPSRRVFLKSLSRSALVLSLESVLAMARPRWLRAGARQKATGVGGAPQAETADLGVSFLNVARESGLNAKTIFGGEHKNKYLLETTGCGVAFYDYDNDGWLDIFLVNGTRLEGFPAGQRADVTSLPQQSRRNFHRRDCEGRSRAFRLGARRVRRRLRQRRMGRSVRYLLRQECSVPQQW